MPSYFIISSYLMLYYCLRSIKVTMAVLKQVVKDVRASQSAAKEAPKTPPLTEANLSHAYGVISSKLASEHKDYVPMNEADFNLAGPD